MLSSRKFRAALGGVALLFVLAVAWCAWQAWQVNRDLQDAVDHADAFQAAVEAGDFAAVDTELAALQDASAAAADGTAGATWSFLATLPVVGDDARGVRLSSEVVRDLSEDGLEPLVAVQDRLDDLLPRDGAVPVDDIADLEEPVAQAERALDAAEERLAGEDSSGYVGRLKDRFDELEDQVAAASDAMASARIAVHLLPGMLGQDGQRNYLLVFQNNAEIRATGGLPGAVSLVSADRGALAITRQATGAQFGRAADAPLPPAAPERRLYANVLTDYFLSSNMTPDVPRAAELWAARWTQEFPEDQVDGVLTLDTVALSYVLDATGPLEIDGIELTGDNVVDELLHNVYLRIEDPAEQDAFFAAVATAAFERFTAGATNPTGLIEALARATNEGRVNVHSFDDVEQAELAGTTIAGELITDTDAASPQIDVTVNDNTAAKMSYFLRYETDINATYCTDGVQGFAGKMRLTSTATDEAKELPGYITGTEGLAPKGSQWVTVRLYGPAGGTVDDVTLNNRPLKPLRVDQDGRPVAQYYIELAPGQTVDVAWTMTSGPGQTADPHVRVTPSIAAGEPAPTNGAC